MNYLRKIAIKFFYFALLWVVPYWYRITMYFTRDKFISVRKRKSKQEIISALSWGKTWTADPLGGVFDMLSHPTKIERNISLGKSVGDCDDHAVYWATCLLKSRLAKRAWLSFYQYETIEGKVSGHVVCVFQDWYGDYFWTDYKTPEKIKHRFEWVTLMEYRKRRVVLGAAEIQVLGVSLDDTPVLGNVNKMR